MNNKYKLIMRDVIEAIVSQDSIFIRNNIVNKTV